MAFVLAPVSLGAPPTSWTRRPFPVIRASGPVSAGWQQWRQLRSSFRGVGIGAARFGLRRSFFGLGSLPHLFPFVPHRQSSLPHVAAEYPADDFDYEDEDDDGYDEEDEEDDYEDVPEDDVLPVPLNLYRIFGLDRNAEPGALDAALAHLASKQLPRGFSSEAASQRKQLIDQAFHVLSDPSKRQSYEQSISGEEPSVQVPLSHIKGALALLLECGQCEDVIQVAREKLSRDEQNTSHGEAVFEDPLPDSDAILATALAFRDIGFSRREENQFDAASESIQEAIEVLRHFHSQRSDPMQPQFRQLESELMQELAELRPNRILELVSMDLRDSNAPYRKKGLQLLSQWLEERGGLDGSGDSGIADETFHEFINVIRPYLLADEQQHLFSPRERKFSPRAMMFLAQLHTARGFTDRNPHEIAEAQRLMFSIDSEIQPIPVELALLSLLVGQAEVALSYLEAIRQRDPGAYHFIRKHSEGAPDMITGLMRALERWLAREVLAKFRDYLDFRVSAQSYFTDPQIVDELSRMRAGASRPVGSKAAPPVQRPVASSSTRFDFESDGQQYAAPSGTSQKRKKKASSRSSAGGLQLEARAKGILSAFPKVVTSAKQGTGRMVALGVAVAVVSGMFLGGVRGLIGKKDNPDDVQVENAEDDNAEGTEQGDQQGQQLPGQGQPGDPSKPGDLQSTSGLVTSSNEPLTPAQTACRSAIQQWQTTKAQAMGPNYAAERLEEVLTEPALSQWRSRAAGAKAGKWYWNYRLENLAVDKVNMDPNNPTKATMDVTLKEDAQFMANGVLKKDQSYSKGYRARYTLVNVGGKWKISSMEVLQ